jgi:excisionase family DNA binding protein
MLHLAEPLNAREVGELRRSIKMKTATTLLECDSKTLRRLLKKGELEGHRLGKRDLRIYLDSIEDYRNRNKIGPSGGNSADNLQIQPTIVDTVCHKHAMSRLKKMGIY